MRLGVAAAAWVLTACVAQGMLGADIGRAGHRLEKRIELQLRLKRGAPPPSPSQPTERSHEDSIEPWELIGV
jgi:predicted small secreted protein